ncbi:MAG TPA: SDR family oxidoreductase [Candidatus Acidoferrales bacterium]|nr:SDR family oxidoreductase [Candidatus Acidoferrales bacterium]
MDSPANGKPDTVLITGGTDGLGRAAAILFASEGWRVFAAGRNAQKRAALEQLAEEKSLSLETIDLDVTSDDSAARAVAEIQRRAGPIDVLVNNAGIGIVATMEEISLDDLRKQFETNVFAAVRVAQHVLPSMRERRRGRIINMSSVAGRVTNPLFGPYSGSKHALEAVSDAMRLEVAPFGIHVVLIEPGFIPTNMGQTSTELSSQYMRNASSSPYARTYLGFLQAWKKITAKPRYTPEDCAQVILRAARATNPRARYPVTREAQIAIAMRWLLSDRRMDKITMRMFGMNGKAGASASPESIQAELEQLVRPRR